MEELKLKAEALGFKFELKSWVPDDYEEDEDGHKRLITKPVSRYRVSYPEDCSFPARWIDPEDTGALEGLIEEYYNRELIYRLTQKRNEEVEAAMGKFKARFGAGAEQ